MEPTSAVVIDVTEQSCILLRYSDWISLFRAMTTQHAQAQVYPLGVARVNQAPALLPDVPGCISSVRRAITLAGDDASALLQSGELSTSSDTALLSLNVDGPRWGVLWAQVACASLPDAWPLGATEHSWGAVNGTVTWLLAAGAGEGDENTDIHLPPSQRALWRPLALVHAPTVELYQRDAGCSLHYVYKGTRHPSAAPMCSPDDTLVEGEPRLTRPPPETWYT